VLFTNSIAVRYGYTESSVIEESTRKHIHLYFDKNPVNLQRIKYRN